MTAEAGSGGRVWDCDIGGDASSPLRERES
jgi:hypothetical protein